MADVLGDLEIEHPDDREVGAVLEGVAGSRPSGWMAPAARTLYAIQAVRFLT